MAESSTTKKFQESELWRKKIKRMTEVRDANKDGAIQRADFKLVVQRFREMGSSEEHLKIISSSFEKGYEKWGLVDESTALTYEEFGKNFVREMEKISKDVGGSIFSGMFQVIDTDSNGTISFNEWVQYYKALGVDPCHAKASFDAMDTNGDGVVSMEEFVAYNKEFFFSTDDTLHSSIMYGPLEWTAVKNMNISSHLIVLN